MTKTLALIAILTFGSVSHAELIAKSIHVSKYDAQTFCALGQNRQVYCWGGTHRFQVPKEDRAWRVPTRLDQAFFADELFDIDFFSAGLVVGRLGNKVVTSRGNAPYSPINTEFDFQKRIRSIHIGPPGAQLIIVTHDGKLELRNARGAAAKWFPEKFADLTGAPASDAIHWRVGYREGICNISKDRGVLCGFEDDDKIRSYIGREVASFIAVKERFAYTLRGVEVGVNSSGFEAKRT